jgi:hypothetical protein
MPQEWNMPDWEYMCLIMALLDEFPDAARTRNDDGLFPLHLMIKKGRRPWKDSNSNILVRIWR